jgi:hypothetical protein
MEIVVITLADPYLPPQVIPQEFNAAWKFPADIGLKLTPLGRFISFRCKSAS